MKKFLSILVMFCVFGLTTVSFVQSAPTTNEVIPIVQGTLTAIDGPFYVIMDNSGKEQRVHVDKSTMIIGKMQPGSKVKVSVTKDGHASAVKNAGS